MKRILYISSIDIFPPNTSGAKVIYNYLQELSKNNFVILLTVQSNDIKSKKNIKNAIVLDKLSRKSGIKFLSPYTLIMFIKIVLKYKPQVLIIEFPWFGLYGVIIKRIFGIPYSIKEQNVEFIRFKRFGKWWWRLLRIYEKFVYVNAQTIYAISQLDEILLEKEFGLSRKKFIYSPYIPDKTLFKKNLTKIKQIRNLLGLNKNDQFILFFGPMDYKPNKEAVEIIVNKIAPAILKIKSTTKFIIVGRNPPYNLNAENIMFTGFVKKIEDYINACDLVIVPVITGGGIRTKILESLACDKIVISTKMAAEGIKQEKNLIVVDSWKQMVKEIEKKLD